MSSESYDPRRRNRIPVRLTYPGKSQLISDGSSLMRSLLHSAQALLPSLMALLCSISSIGLAEPIYSWKGKDGVTVYSSSPKSPRARQRELPEIMKHADPARGRSFKDPCTQQGGKSCDKGPSANGSVQCRDGEPSESVPFRWGCPTALLEVVEFEQAPQSNSVTVVLRNLRDVKAY